jgi:DNA topoisomerase I
MEQGSALQLSHRDYLEADGDYEKSASIVKLLYIKDTDPGILRKKRGKGFSYVFESVPIKEKSEIERIRKLAIPPAWEEVWICKEANGHIQATGIDLLRRKQYRYHALWHVFRNETKFHRLYEFGKSLPKLRAKMEQDISSRELTQEKVLATVLSLMERTYIRVGNNGYEKLYGSYGLTTLKDRHVEINGDKMVFSFKGKKGIHHNITLRNKKLAKTVKECKDIPGKELFQYYDAEGNRRSIDSGMVNNYIKEATGMDFTAKNFRTWAGSLHALQAFYAIGGAETETERKKNIVAALDEVSKKLGNSRSVCRKYYVHPGLIRLYEENKLMKYLSSLEKMETTEDKTGLAPEEEILMQVLKNS